MGVGRSVPNVQKRRRVVLDLGNALLKGLIEGLLHTVKTIPHAVKFLTKREYEATQERMSNGVGRGTESGSSLFHYQKTHKTTDIDGKKIEVPVSFYCVVGEFAEDSGAKTWRSGGPKYDVDYYPALAMAMLIHLLPDGCEDLELVAAFPPDDVRFTPILRAALGGRHIITFPDGRQVSYAVRSVKNFDEPVGGMWNFMFAPNGVNYNKDIPSGMGLCVDIGGKLTTLTRFNSSGWVDYSTSRTLDMGIHDVFRSISRSLLADSKNARYFREQRGDLPFDQTMRECLRTGIYEAAGHEINALDAVADGTTMLRNEIKQTYDLLGGARPYKFILVSGGGGGSMIDQLTEHVLNFNPRRVYQAHEDRDMMHLACVLGGDKGLAAADFALANEPVPSPKKQKAR